MIHARGLCVHYGAHCALHDIDLDVDAGEFVGVVGPNGGGKSTLVRALLGLLPSAHGHLDVQGPVGYVPQDAAHADDHVPVSVDEFVLTGRIGRRFWRPPGNADRQAVADALEETGLQDHARRRLSHLSGGQRQRAHLARALAQGARLLILDEPTTGVDHRSRDKVHRLLEHLCKDHALTVLMVSHDTDSLARHATRVLWLDRTITHDGPARDARAWADGTPDARPAHPFGAHA